MTLCMTPLQSYSEKSMVFLAHTPGLSTFQVQIFNSPKSYQSYIQQTNLVRSRKESPCFYFLFCAARLPGRFKSDHLPATYTTILNRRTQAQPIALQAFGVPLIGHRPPSVSDRLQSFADCLVDNSIRNPSLASACERRASRHFARPLPDRSARKPQGRDEASDDITVGPALRKNLIFRGAKDLILARRRRIIAPYRTDGLKFPVRD